MEGSWLEREPLRSSGPLSSPARRGKSSKVSAEGEWGGETSRSGLARSATQQGGGALTGHDERWKSTADDRGEKREGALRLMHGLMPRAGRGRITLRISALGRDA